MSIICSLFPIHWHWLVDWLKSLTQGAFRPISVVPKLSQGLERFVISGYICSAFRSSRVADMLQHQFAFRPTGFTTASIVDLLQKITNMLQKNDYVCGRFFQGLTALSIRRWYKKMKILSVAWSDSQLAGSLLPVPGPCDSTWRHHFSHSLY